MGSIAELIDAARRAGCTIEPGPCNRLKITGPKSADGLARQLLARKQDVLRAICWPHGPFDKTPTPHGQRWVCSRCGRFFGYGRELN